MRRDPAPPVDAPAEAPTPIDTTTEIPPQVPEPTVKSPIKEIPTPSEKPEGRQSRLPTSNKATKKIATKTKLLNKQQPQAESDPIKFKKRRSRNLSTSTIHTDSETAYSSLRMDYNSDNNTSFLSPKYGGPTLTDPPYQEHGQATIEDTLI